MSRWLRPAGVAVDLLSCRSASPSMRCIPPSLGPAPNRAIRRWASHHSRPLQIPAYQASNILREHVVVGPYRGLNTLLRRRAFHTSPPRRDILFVSVPAFKAFLLSITRVTLVVLPFWWRRVTFRLLSTYSLDKLLNGHILQMEALQAVSQSWQDAVAITGKLSNSGCFLDSVR